MIKTMNTNLGSRVEILFLDIWFINHVLNPRCTYASSAQIDFIDAMFLAHRLLFQNPILEG